MHYTHQTQLTKKEGNNAFAFDARVQQDGFAQLSVSTLKEIRSIQEIGLGSEHVFVEVASDNTVKHFTGLAYLYQRDKYRLFDNHNHALYFWAQRTKQQGPTTVIHIDQHADLGVPPSPIDPSRCNDLEYIWEYANCVCNVGNFIIPALEGSIISECKQRRTEYAVLHEAIPDHPYILDIDLDFRDPSMSNQHKQQTLKRTRALMDGALGVTIATSPYFLDQHYALELLHELFPQR